jgi:hypothetical protein
VKESNLKFDVVRGYVEREGALFTRGSSFDAPETEVKAELAKGIIVPAKKGKIKPEDPDEL